MKAIKYYYRHFGWLPYVLTAFIQNWITIPFWLSYTLGFIAITWIIFVFIVVGFRDQG
tara:strand:- start:1239 stop:1412 length:174 start_codon:yes stop_codon:yes gene_type:complete